MEMRQKNALMSVVVTKYAAMMGVLLNVSTMLQNQVYIAPKAVCFSRLLKCLRSLYGKLCGPRSDCSYRSSLFWVHTVCLYTSFVSNVGQLFAADNFCRRDFQMHFFLDALRVKHVEEKR